MELNIAIVDDTLSDRLRLKSFIQNRFALSKHKLGEIITCSSGEEFLKCFEPKIFQIVFMDIIMNTLNGVETALQLRAEDTELLIVFITTSREYAFDAFPVHPFDYVLKPYTRKDVDRVLNEAVRVLSAQEPSITFRVSHSEYTIPLRLISSAVSHGHYVEINLADGKSLLSSMTFREAEKIFADDSRFLLCNRGIIVNMSQIAAQENGAFIMKNGTHYPIRVNGQSKIQAAFHQYLIANMRANVKRNN
ncbi:MAG: response regulator transcription factor [Synergistaceae bacterium]|nr:response regulator transcription factor [Synergistaceae bacterium]